SLPSRSPFLDDTPTTERSTLSLHDALPIYQGCAPPFHRAASDRTPHRPDSLLPRRRRNKSPARRRDTAAFVLRENPGGEEFGPRSEEHTSELQSHLNLVCRLLLEKNKHQRD